MNDLLENIGNSRDKAIKVIESCENQVHIKGAEKYVKLLVAKHQSDISKTTGEYRKSYDNLISSVENLLLAKLKIEKEKVRMSS